MKTQIAYLLFGVLVSTGCQNESTRNEIIIGADSYKSSRWTNPLPKVADVASFAVRFEDHEQEIELEFSAPREHWQKLLDTLVPAKRDPNPAAWVSIGRITVTQTNGDKLMVFLYHTSEELGAFAKGKSHEQRIYYRGGKSSQLVEAIRDAHATLSGNER